MSYRKIAAAIGVPCSTVRYNINPGTKERNNQYMAKYRNSHKAEKAIYMKNYYQDHKVERDRYLSGYRETHREDAKQYSAEYRRIHRLDRCQFMAQYYEAHKTAFRKYMNVYYQGHKAEFMARNAQRRALKTAATIGATISQKAEIADIYRRAHDDAKVRCYLCGCLIPKGHRHVDHIVPLSKGGKHRPSNLAVACDKCNSHKGAKFPAEVGLLL